MIRLRHLLFALPAMLLLACGYNIAPEPQERRGLDGLQWLIGEWVSEGEQNITYESWAWENAALTGVGRSRSKASGEVSVTETLQLVSRNGDILYIPTVAHNPGPVAFTLVQQSLTRFVFENPAHDFPTRIVYERLEPQRMRVTVSGSDEHGFAIEFRRLE